MMMKKKNNTVSSSSRCPRHARRGCFPGCLRIWRRKRTAAALLLFGPRTHKQDAQTPLSSADRRTKQHRLRPAVRLCCSKPEPRSPITDSSAHQSRVAWVDRLSSHSQSKKKGGGRRIKRRTTDGCTAEICPQWSLYLYFYCVHIINWNFNKICVSMLK